MTAPVAGRSLGPQDLQSARYTSRLPVAMRLACLNQNCSNYGDEYDDSQKDIVPNSQSDYATSDGSGPDSEFYCHTTKFQFSYHVTAVCLFCRLFFYIGARGFARYIR